MEAAVSLYKRHPPPFVARCGFGLVMYGIVAPAVWSLERLGMTARAIAPMIARQHRMTAARNPFRGYVPTAHERHLVERERNRLARPNDHRHGALRESQPAV